VTERRYKSQTETQKKKGKEEKKLERQNSEAERFERAPPEKQKATSIRSLVYPLHYLHNKLEIF